MTQVYFGFGDDRALFETGKPAVCCQRFEPANSISVRLTKLSANALLQEGYDYKRGRWGEKHLWHVVKFKWDDSELHVETSHNNLYLDAQGRWSQFQAAPGMYKHGQNNDL
jgi:hypothetical protein